jgi:hypothetical protein
MTSAAINDVGGERNFVDQSRKVGRWIKKVLIWRNSLGCFDLGLLDSWLGATC